MTCRSQAVKSLLGGHRPRRPVRSRCVCALTRPGRTATSPRSTLARRALCGSTAMICALAMVTTPLAIGGPLTGNTQRAVSVHGDGDESVEATIGRGLTPDFVVLPSDSFPPQ